jgi:hypothetical protein
MEFILPRSTVNSLGSWGSIFKWFTKQINLLLRARSLNFSLYMKYMKNADFWNVAPCRYCVIRRFGGTYRLHFQGTAATCSRRDRARVFFIPGSGRRSVPPKRRFTQYLHGTTSHNAAFSIVTAVTTSNLIKNYFQLSSLYLITDNNALTFNSTEIRKYTVPIDHWRSQCGGRFSWPTPYIHTVPKYNRWNM